MLILTIVTKKRKKRNNMSLTNYIILAVAIFFVITIMIFCFTIWDLIDTSIERVKKEIIEEIKRNGR